MLRRGSFLVKFVAQGKVHLRSPMLNTSYLSLALWEGDRVRGKGGRCGRKKRRLRKCEKVRRKERRGEEGWEGKKGRQARGRKGKGEAA